MTIFGDNLPPLSDNTSTSHCGFALHNTTRTDTTLNYIFGVSLVSLAFISLVGNSSVLVYYKRRQLAAAAFSEFERLRKYMTIARAFIDLLYNIRSLYIAYVLLSSYHEPICGEMKPIYIVFLSITTYSLALLSINMTFLISVLNYANIRTLIFRLNFRHSYRVIISFFTVGLFLVIFILELESPISQQDWFSPIQLPFHGQNYGLHNGLKWSLFVFKLTALLLHIIVVVTAIRRLSRLFKIVKIKHIHNIYLSMILLILGNCVCMFISLFKDLVTNFVDFDITLKEDPTEIHPYNQMYIIFIADIFISSLLSAYNPLVFIRNSSVARQTIYIAMTEAVSFTGLSVSRRFSRAPVLPSVIPPQNAQFNSSDIVCDEDKHRPLASSDLGGGTTRKNYRTLSLTFWTNSIESREPVSGSHVQFPLSHIPSKPVITIPVHCLMHPMTLPFVGQGSYGKVYQFTDHTIGCSVAIKHIDIPSSSARCEVEDVKKEVSSFKYTVQSVTCYTLLCVLNLNYFHVKRLVTEQLFNYKRYTVKFII